MAPGRRARSPSALTLLIEEAMSTRSQRFKSAAERTHAAVPNEAKHAAPHAEKEAVAKDKSGNHVKTDVGAVRAEQMKQASPETQARKNIAAAQRVRAPGAR
jgi:hypothetical protein